MSLIHRREMPFFFFRPLWNHYFLPTHLVEHLHLNPNCKSLLHNLSSYRDKIIKSKILPQMELSTMPLYIVEWVRLIFLPLGIGITVDNNSSSGSEPYVSNFNKNSDTYTEKSLHAHIKWFVYNPPFPLLLPGISLLIACTTSHDINNTITIKTKTRNS